jgi:hypothetical protein
MRGMAQNSLDLIEAARVILEEIQPATVRAACYRLFTQNLIDRGEHQQLLQMLRSHRTPKHCPHSLDQGLEI